MPANETSNRDADVSAQRPTMVRYLVLALIAFAASSAYLTRHCISVANTTIQKDLDLSPGQMGWVLASFSGGYFLFQVPGGWMGNRYGTRAIFPCISALWSLFTVWTAYASSLRELILSRICFGCAQGGLVPLSSKIIKDWMPLSRHGFSSALIGASMSLGGALTMKMTGILMHYLNGDWRLIFQLYSIVGLVWAVVFYALFRTKPEEHRWVNQAECDMIRGRSDPPSLEDDHPEHLPSTDGETGGELIRQMIASRTMWAICIQAAFRAAGYMLLVTWLTAFLEYAYEMENIDAAAYNVYPLLTLILGTLLGGTVVDFLLRLTGSRFVSRTLMAIVSLSLCGLFTLLAASTGSVSGFVMMMSIGSFFSGLANPTAWTATMDISGRHTAVVMGVMNMAGGIGAFSLPVVVGYLVEHIKATDGDWNLVIYFVAALYFACAITWFWVNPNDTLSAPDEYETGSPT